MFLFDKRRFGVTREGREATERGEKRGVFKCSARGNKEEARGAVKADSGRGEYGGRYLESSRIEGDIDGGEMGLRVESRGVKWVLRE